MAELNNIGLSLELSEKTADKLNQLLANFQIYYQNLRGFHWNIQGKNFFSLHEKFEEYYTEAAADIDEIAERILTLGFTPLHSFDDYVKASSIKADKNVKEGKKAIELLITYLQTLLKIEREVLKAADAAADEGTLALASDLLNKQEKTIWMLSSWQKDL